MRTKITLALFALAISASQLAAQAPSASAPQTGVPATAAAPVAATPMANDGHDAALKAALMQSLLQLKAANDEILKRQTATLGQLDETVKSAEQMRTFSSRG